MARIRLFFALAASASILGACGTYVPAKDIFRSDTRRTSSETCGQTIDGRAEANLIGNISCEVGNALYEAAQLKHDQPGSIAYMYSDKWGTQITLKLTWDELSALAPGLSFIHPEASAQSKSIGLGGSASAHATRVETITFIMLNHDLKKYVDDYIATNHRKPDCSVREDGTMIRGDLKIADFIVDKATIARLGIAATGNPNASPFSAFQEEITFVGAYSGNITPTWKLARFNANTTGNFLAATRTTTGDVLITLGLIKKDPVTGVLSLQEPAASQHTAAIIGSAAATQLTSQNH